jgi:cytochrome c oxidase cbb3-type subunit 2
MSVRSLHEFVEKNGALLLILIIISISVGGIVQIVPLFINKETVQKLDGIRPYTPLELLGRNIYIREGCYVCHSQMIRPFKDEYQRYGRYSDASESMYDYPFQWGSKRTGPDLARVGNKYSNTWQVQHLINPRSLVPESIMPSYAHLAKRELDLQKINIRKHLEVMQFLGVPYTYEMAEDAERDLKMQADANVADFEAFLTRYPKAVVGDIDGNPEKLTEMDALVAYLQILGSLAEFDDASNADSNSTKTEKLEEQEDKQGSK